MCLDAVSVNQLKPNGFFPLLSIGPAHFCFILGAVGIVLNFIQVLIEQSVSKQWRPLSDAAFWIWTV